MMLPEIRTKHKKIAVFHERRDFLNIRKTLSNISAAMLTTKAGRIGAYKNPAQTNEMKIKRAYFQDNASLKNLIIA
jgi:hypothetical protein